MMFSADNLRIRKVEPTDLPLLYYIENSDDSWNDSDIHNPLSQKDISDYIYNSTGDIYKDGQLRLIIQLNTSVTDNQLETDSSQSNPPTSLSDLMTIGCVDLYDFDPRNSKVAVGIYIIAGQRSKGYALKVLQMLEKYVFGFLNIRLLYAFVASKNAASLRLFTSAGYRQVAVLPAWLLNDDVCLFLKQNSNFLTK